MKKEIETIHPTHTCFDDALELFMVFAKNQRIRPTLVHAICQKEDGEKFSHAWVERDGVVYFVGLVNGKKYGFECELPAYYAKLLKKVLLTLQRHHWCCWRMPKPYAKTG